MEFSLLSVNKISTKGSPSPTVTYLVCLSGNTYRLFTVFTVAVVVLMTNTHY